MEFHFAERGFIKPYTFVEIDLELFKKVFVEDFKASVTRKKLFDTYLQYLDNLRTCIEEKDFYQWINGSFVSNKLNPKDIDFVTFVPTVLYRVQEENLRALKVFEKQGIDSYFVEIFPSEHSSYSLYLSDRLYWLDLFSYARRNLRNNKRYEKGFVQISF